MPEADERAVAGPWSLTLLDMPPAPTGLPEGFPVDDVPLVGGRLVSVSPMRGASGEGWSVEIAVDGDDAAKEAVRLLGDDLVDLPGAGAPARHHLLRGGLGGRRRSVDVGGRRADRRLLDPPGLTRQPIGATARSSHRATARAVADELR